MLTRIKSDLDLLTGALTSTSIIFTETVMVIGISSLIFFYDPKSFFNSIIFTFIFCFNLFFISNKKIAHLRILGKNLRREDLKKPSRGIWWYKRNKKF